MQDFTEERKQLGIGLYKLYLISSFGVLLLLFDNHSIKNLSDVLLRYLLGAVFGAIITSLGSSFQSGAAYIDKKPIASSVLAILSPFIWTLILLTWIAYTNLAR